MILHIQVLHRYRQCCYKTTLCLVTVLQLKLMPLWQQDQHRMRQIGVGFRHNVSLEL